MSTITTSDPVATTVRYLDRVVEQPNSQPARLALMRAISSRSQQPDATLPLLATKIVGIQTILAALTGAVSARRHDQELNSYLTGVSELVDAELQILLGRFTNTTDVMPREQLLSLATLRSNSEISSENLQVWLLLSPARAERALVQLRSAGIIERVHECQDGVHFRLVDGGSNVLDLLNQLGPASQR